MGTRSLTYVYSENGKPLVCMYGQYDGYPSGHGAELAEFLNAGQLVNGISLGETSLVFNGMRCLAAALVSYFKKEAGGFYLQEPIPGRDDWQEYEYHIYKDKVIVKAGAGVDAEVIFDGTWENFSYFCNKVE